MGAGYMATGDFAGSGRVWQFYRKNCRSRRIRNFRQVRKQKMEVLP